MRAFVGRNYLAVCLIGLVSATSSIAQVREASPSQRATKSTKASDAFYRGYYLQNEQNDPEAALKAYQQSLKLGASNELRQQIHSQIATLQEDIAVADFAQLMPSDAFAYFEVNRVGHHAEKIAAALGIVGQPNSDSERVVLRIEDEVQIPSDFKISPALIREIKKTRGAAVAVTGIQESGPSAVGVIHPGDSDLITGMIETGVQLVRSEDTIGGFPTYCIENQVWFVKTNRLVFVANQRDLIEGCIERIQDSDSESIADNANFQEARTNHDDYAVFAYVNPNRALKQLGRVGGRELAVARVLLDMDHMRHVTASLSASEHGLHFKTNLALDDKHNNLAYGMLRTVPLSKKALSSVPAGSAAVLGMGLNPKMALAAEAASQQRITGLDLGRELFANIEELALFVLPSISEQNSGVPNFGIVIAANDADKSEALWNQMLKIPSMVDVDSGRVSEVRIAGVTAKSYRLPDNDVPEILICRLNKDSMVAGTNGAVAAAIEAAQSGANLGSDSIATGFNSAITQDTAKAFYAHVGRCLQLASQLERGSDAQQLRMIGQVVENMNLTVLCDEAESNLQVRTSIVELPRFENIIKSIAKMQSSQGRVVRANRRSSTTWERKASSKTQESHSDRAADF